MMKSASQSSIGAVLTALPWCCLAPLALAWASLSLAAAARWWAGEVTLALGVASGVFLGRALWLAFVRRRGGPRVRWATGASATVAVLLWLPRLGSI